MSGMSPTALWTMVVICGFVWGTFISLVVRALRSEAAKQRRQS
jgi:hypothetical protein